MPTATAAVVGPAGAGREQSATAALARGGRPRSMGMLNRQIILASRPVGLPKLADFQLVFSPLPTPAAGEVLVRTVYLSLDASMREQMNESAYFARPNGIGEVLGGPAVGIVLESKDAGFAVGDAVEGMFGWQEYAIAAARDLRRLELDHTQLSNALGVLGTPGLTAYFGLIDVCDPQPGETVVVSGAAGAVGMIAGQLAAIRGCRVVGVARSEAKLSWLTDELGFDAALNSAASSDLDGELAALCPHGIDVFFDNVGGVITDAALRRINTHARIALCGQTSQNNLEEVELGPRGLSQLIVKQAKMQGFRVGSYAARFGVALEQLGHWQRQGRIRYREDVAQGIEAAPLAFIGMLLGKNQGRQLVRLSDN